MQKIPKRYSHFLHGAIQSGLTCAVSAAIASLPYMEAGGFAANWFALWLRSWAAILPVVLLASPYIRLITARLTSTT